MIAPQMAEIAALVGDPARANILGALFDGRALTATELSYAASVSPQTTSGHLAKLTQANLLTVVKQGRHRYYRLGAPREDALRLARTCYDHIAGQLGVAIADSLCAKGHVILGDDGGQVT